MTRKVEIYEKEVRGRGNGDKEKKVQRKRRSEEERNDKGEKARREQS